MGESYGVDPVTKDADEDTRVVAKDLQPVDLSSIAKPGEICMFWAEGLECSNPLAFPEDGRCVVIYLSDFQCVYKLPGFIREKSSIVTLYEKVSVLHYTAAASTASTTAIMEEGFDRSIFTEILREFAGLFQDSFREDFFAEVANGAASAALLSVATEGAEEEVAEIARVERRKFEERTALVGAESGAELANNDNNGRTNTTPGVSRSVGAQKAAVAVAWERKLNLACNELCDLIGVLEIEDEDKEDNNKLLQKLEPKKTIDVLSSIINLLTLEYQYTFTINVGIARFFRTILPYKYMVIKENT